MKLFRLNWTYICLRLCKMIHLSLFTYWNSIFICRMHNFNKICKVNSWYRFVVYSDITWFMIDYMIHFVYLIFCWLWIPNLLIHDSWSIFSLHRFIQHIVASYCTYSLSKLKRWMRSIVTSMQCKNRTIGKELMKRKCALQEAILVC